MTADRAAVIAYHSSPLHEPGSGDAGGMTIYIRGLTEALARRGLHTDIFTRRDAAVPRIVTLAPGVRVVSIDAGPTYPVPKGDLVSYIPDFVAGVRAFCMSTRTTYDLVHSHYWQSGVVAGELTSRWGVPFVHSSHTLAKVKNRFLAPGDRPETSTRVDGEMAVIESAGVLVASTDEEQEQLACLYRAPHDRLKTVHPGLDHSVFAPRERASSRLRYGIDRDAKVLLSVGRLEPLKGVDLAIRAVEELKGPFGEDATLLVAGGPSGPDGAEPTRLRKLAGELGVERRVRFLGPVPHQDLPELYSAADVVVVCSHTESFGFAALEAHACGVPVVATAVGGLSHIVRDGVSGHLLEERDPSELAGRVKTLLADPSLRDEFGRAAAEASREFDWDRSAAEFLDLYECLVQSDATELCTCM